MKSMPRLLFTFLFTILLIPSFGQSKKQMESYLRNDWTSAAITYETGDTIQDLDQSLILGKKGKMSTHMDGIDRTGTWKYLEDSKILQLVINIGDTATTLDLEIANSSEQILSLTQRRGNRYKTLILVEKGSGLGFETVKVPEMSFAEIQAESDAKRNADLGYTPSGEVIKRFDYNFVLTVEEDGAGSSKGDGIVYLLENEGSQILVIINGQDSAPEEWTILEEVDVYGETVYKCNLQYTYKRGEKIEVNTKADLKFDALNVYLEFEDGKVIKFTNV